MIKWIILIVIGLYLIFTMVLFCVDFVYYLIERYGRYHIGKFDSVEMWESKLIKRGIKWLRHEPTVKMSDNNRYLLFDMLGGKYRNNTIQSWQKGALILGLSKISKNDTDKAIRNLVSNGKWKNKPTNVDCGLLSYAILKNSDEKNIVDAMYYSYKIIKSNLGQDGMINYTNNPYATERYVDTIGLTVPFLFLFARKYQNEEAYDIAIKQLKEFQKYGLHSNSLLPNHAYDANTKLPLGNYGWGRGCAWYVIGLIDSYYEIEKKEDREWLQKHIKTIADSYMVFQHDDGGFGRIFQLRTGYDSSATSVMAYYYKCCYKIFEDEKYNEVYKKCLVKLKSVTKITGAIDWCQGDTKDIGVLSQTFSIMPFAQGMLIRSLERKK